MSHFKTFYDNSHFGVRHCLLDLNHMTHLYLYCVCVVIVLCMIIKTDNNGLHHSYAVVTPLRKAASYEQRKTNLGNQNFRRRSATYYAALTRAVNRADGVAEFSSRRHVDPVRAP